VTRTLDVDYLVVGLDPARCGPAFASEATGAGDPAPSANRVIKITVVIATAKRWAAEV
jgi:hypothetical protein